MEIIETLHWDSDFFGFEIGKTTVEHADSFPYNEFELAAQQYKLVYIFSKEYITFKNFKFVDRKAVFLQATSTFAPPKKSTLNLCSFDQSKHDLEALIELSLLSGVYSRFKTDRNFTREDYKKLYTTWILNSVSGKLAFEIIIAEKDGEILGFTSLAKKNVTHADIGLVAVNSKTRGQGIATALINKTISMAREKGFDEIQVVTQMDNHPAVSLYNKTGFKLIEKTNIYHYWNL